MMKKITALILLLTLSACERDIVNETASLRIDNLTDTGTMPLSVWSVYIYPASSATPQLERSADLLASEDLDPGLSKTFSIDLCDQLIDVQVIFSNGAEQRFSSVADVACDSTYSCVIDDLGVMNCS